MCAIAINHYRIAMTNSTHCRIRILFLSCCSALLVTFGFGQAGAQSLNGWTRVMDVPNASVTGVWPGKDVVVAQFHSAIFGCSTDQGRTWTRHDMNVGSAYVADNGNIVAVGMFDGIAYSENMGETFQTLDILEAGVGGGEGEYVVGEGNTVCVVNRLRRESNSGPKYWDTLLYRSVDGGRNWLQIAKPPVMFAQWLLGPDGTFYGLRFQGTELYSYDDVADSWSLETVLPGTIQGVFFGRDGRLYSIAFDGMLLRSDPGSVELKGTELTFAPADYINVNSRGEIFVVPPIVPPYTVFRVSPTGTDTVFFELLERTDYWKMIPERLSFGSSDDDIWALDYNIVGAYRYDLGSELPSWQPVQIPGYADVQSIDVEMNGDPVVMTESRAYRIDSKLGRPQELMFPMGRRFVENDQVVVNDSTLLIGSYRSEDGGETWDQLSSKSLPKYRRGPNGTLVSVQSVTGQISFDRGAKWDRPDIVSVAGPSNAAYNNSHFYWFANKLFYSSDNGQTWQEAVPERVASSLATVTGNGTVISADYRPGDDTLAMFYYSRYSRDERMVVEHTSPCARSFFEAAFTTDPLGNPWMATQCGMFVSADDGLTWTKTGDIPEGAFVTALTFDAEGYAHLGTTRGLFRASEPSSVGGILSIQASALSVHSTPNPATDAADITFELPRASHVVVTVVDALGRTVDVVADRAFEAGTNSVRWGGAASVPAGTYLVSVRTDDGTSTTKLVVGGSR